MLCKIIIWHMLISYVFVLKDIQIKNFINIVYSKVRKNKTRILSLTLKLWLNINICNSSLINKHLYLTTTDKITIYYHKNTLMMWELYETKIDQKHCNNLVQEITSLMSSHDPQYPKDEIIKRRTQSLC